MRTEAKLFLIIVLSTALILVWAPQIIIHLWESIPQ